APYVFCGALESDYTAGNIPADRFLKNVTKFVVSRDIADLPFASIANQTYTGSAIDPIEADGGLELFDGFYLKPDEDFIYTISNNTEIGTATIEIEGTGSLDSDDQYYVENGWTGTTTLTFKITDSNTPDRTTTSVTFKNGDQTIFTFPLSTIEEWAESSTDNTSALMYEAVDGTDATAYYIPAGKYVTASTISSKIGATAWTSIAFENEDGSTYTVDNGTYYFYPNLSVSDGTITYDTSGMVEVPTVLAFEWYDEAITTDAESAAEDAMSGTANTAVCGFSGISSSDYSADGNLSNARFVTNADDVTMLGTYKTATLTDILAGQWYTEYVNSAVDLGLMTGYTGQNIFDPDGDLTRAQALTVIYRAVVSNSDDTKDPSLYASNETPFTDVESDMWYTAAINWAYKNGITTGYLGTDLFGVDDLINRAELATFIGRVASSIENIDISDADPSAAEECTDWETVVEDTPYAVESLEWTAAENILAGDENADGSRTMDPLGTALRSQMAKVIVDTLNVFLNGSVDVY
ncbi:MAG: S-layer homology domain-containing protein, partial [Eggerthellaceae bacterium]|nr:S-layer homology domain-containing protein [Eggerthellaceae bacterium]